MKQIKVPVFALIRQIFDYIRPVAKINGTATLFISYFSFVILVLSWRFVDYKIVIHPPPAKKYPMLLNSLLNNSYNKPLLNY